jgi:hypothetical protein
MAGPVSEIKGVLAHLEQATVNAQGPVNLAKREVERIGGMTGNRLGDSHVGRDTVALLAETISDFNHGMACMHMAARRLRLAIDQVESL